MINDKIGKNTALHVRVAYFLCTPLLLLIGVVCFITRTRFSVEFGQHGDPSPQTRLEMAREMSLNHMRFIVALHTDITTHSVNEDGTHTLSERGANAVRRHAKVAQTILAGEGEHYTFPGQHPATAEHVKES